MKINLRKDSKLDDQIDEVIKSMGLLGPGTDEYERQLEHLERLMKLQSTETWTRRINPDTVAVVVGNLALAAFIRIYEEKHVAVSKGFGMFLRSKNASV